MSSAVVAHGGPEDAVAAFARRQIGAVGLGSVAPIVAVADSVERKAVTRIRNAGAAVRPDPVGGGRRHTERTDDGDRAHQAQHDGNDDG